jgi:FkbM family methyltransferase
MSENVGDSKPGVTRLAACEFRGNEFRFMPTPDALSLMSEIFNDCYGVFEKKVAFQPGDVVLDFGACEGMFSIMLAKTFPGITVHAYEPVPRTYETLLQNIKLNDCKNIYPFNFGLGMVAGSVVLNVSKDHAGGSTSLCTFNPDHHDKVTVHLQPFDSIIQKFHNANIRLVKMDIEGMEYDVLYSSSLLCRVLNFCGELHINTQLEYRSRRMDALATWISNQTNVVGIELCKMAE